MDDLIPLAETIAARLKARRESIVIAESSTGGMISAALLALPGASAYFLGGAVAYTRQAKILLLGLDETELTKFPGDRAARALACAQREGALRRIMGPGRNRRDGTDWQPLRRPGRPHLSCGCWRRGASYYA